MDLTVSSLTQIFTNRAKIHRKIVVADDLMESIRGGYPLQKSHRFCANLTDSPRDMWGFKPPVATPLSLTTSENFIFEPTAVMHSDVSTAFSLVVVTKTITPVLVGFSNRPLSKNHWKTLSVQFTRQERYFIRPCGRIATYMWISSAYS